MKLDEIRIPFNMEIPEDIIKISKIFKSNGYSLFIVGGSIRDAWLKKEPKDFDLATDALPEYVESILNSSYKTLGTGKAFGVINVFTESGEFEIATFRTDLSGGRRPDAVKFTTIDNDVKRRDLTINALFYDLEHQEVVDLVGGIEDLERGIIRTVGNPAERFSEDRLRILRAVRFAARFGHDLDEETSKAIMADNDLSGVSRERVRDEFLKGIASAKSVPFFIDLLWKYNLMDQIFPGIRKAGGSIDTRCPEFLIAHICQYELNEKNGWSMLRKKLLDLCYTKREVKRIIFLLSFKYSLSINEASCLKDTERRMNEDEIMISKEEIREFSVLMHMDSKFVNAYFEYELSIKGGDVAAEGFIGKGITDEVKRRESELFRAILEKN